MSESSPATNRLVMHGPRGFGPSARGLALVAKDGFSARYDLNHETGVISRESHSLIGESIAGKILVFDFAKGGVATSWRLLDLVERGVGPAGLIFNVLNPVMVQGAVLADIPIMHGLAPDPIGNIRSGSEVIMYPADGRIEVSNLPDYAHDIDSAVPR